MQAKFVYDGDSKRYHRAGPSGSMPFAGTDGRKVSSRL